MLWTAFVAVARSCSTSTGSATPTSRSAVATASTLVLGSSESSTFAIRAPSVPSLQRENTGQRNHYPVRPVVQFVRELIERFVDYKCFQQLRKLLRVGWNHGHALNALTVCT